MPGSGLISERNHTAGEKIHCEAFGCVRDVLALNGHSTVRLRPSAPTASFTLRILSRAWRSWRSSSSCGQAFAHILEGLASHVELAGLEPWPS